jgi:selenophosphate synthase
MLLFDAQTSGGLLLSVPPQKLDGLFERAAQTGQELWRVGEVIEGHLIEVIK